MPTEKAVVHNYRTYAPLTVRNTSWDRRAPQPNQPLTLNFTNQLNEEAFQSEWVTVSPAVADFEVVCRYSRINHLRRIQS